MSSGNRSNDMSMLEAVLSASQEFMRNKNDECSFVSLRDVERTLKVGREVLSSTDARCMEH